MSLIVSVHSFRGGTGKSNTTANVATLLAAQGYRVGVIDTDIQSPGIHILFSLDEKKAMKYALNDYLWGKCAIEQAAYDVTPNLGALAGRVLLIPSSIKVNDIARVLREGYDVALLNDGYQRLLRELQLDLLMIDTHPGLNEETLLSIAVSDTLIIVLRPDQQDYQGTGVTLEVARRLEVPHMLLMVNKVPPAFNLDNVRSRVQQAYDCEVIAVLPHSDEMMTLGSAGIFALQYPDDPVTQQLKNVAAALLRAARKRDVAPAGATSA